MSAFRSVKNSSGEPMAGHCRPLCPLNGRSIRSCVIEDVNDIENNQENNDVVEDVEEVEKDGDDDKENELPDENVNYHGNDAETAEFTEKNYFDENYNLEVMVNHNE